MSAPSSANGGRESARPRRPNHRCGFAAAAPRISTVRPFTGDVLDTRGYAGIIDYDPTELVMTARAGTLLDDIEQATHAAGQMLAFEPPHFDARHPSAATLGGCVAAGLSGPRRPYAGAVRDLVLGVRILDGRGEDLTFGGRVMKNVAGFDVARLMTGSLGTLGMLLDISFKCLPAPKMEATRVIECSPDDAIRRHERMGRPPAPGVGHLLSPRACCRFDCRARRRPSRRRWPRSAATRCSTRKRALPSGVGCATRRTRISQRAVRRRHAALAPCGQADCTVCRSPRRTADRMGRRRALGDRQRPQRRRAPARLGAAARRPRDAVSRRRQERGNVPSAARGGCRTASPAEGASSTRPASSIPAACTRAT